ncbi:MAG: hypothetical protein EOO73_10270 [Myxococcales bacterium]|nr:MAG: hypothetical protein EOO73_10270 [Myxococcales bacterium]
MASKLRFGLLFLALVGCASSARFPLKAPLTRDADDAPFAAAPEEYYSPFAWDGANYMVFHPISRFFAVDPAGAATNVNALDEVPDSSWFENRLGVRRMTAEEVTRGACDDAVLDPNAPDGTWTIDKGKDNGANPGFRVNIEGLGKFMLKVDTDDAPDRATGATAIASRVYHAVGYYSACDTVVYFRPSLLKLKPGLTVTNNEGVTRPFDEAALGAVLKTASHRNGLVRMVASSWLPGKPIGPYRYEGTRDDDPNDVIPHEDRREVRAGRLVAAWLNHFDSREQNTMDVFLPAEKGRKDGPGYVRHYIIDMGDCFGSQWAVDGISRRLGNSYIFDGGHVGEDFITLGTIERPWEKARLTGGIFGYFSARDFDPQEWRGEYPNPAFMRMTEQDGAWMARILAGFDDELTTAVVKVGQYDTISERYLTETLIARRRAILQRYFAKVSPIGRISANQEGVCGVDLARATGIVPNEEMSFRAYLYRGADLEPAGKPRFRRVAAPDVCVDIPHRALPPSVPAEDPERYVVLDITNGYAPGPLRVHLYDQGTSGYRLAGVERPEALKRPK